MSYRILDLVAGKTLESFFSAKCPVLYNNRLLARVCAVNNCLIKTVPSCSLCGVLSLISV